MVSKIESSTSLAREHWGEFFDQFSDSNRGRSICLESISLELGDEELIQNTPLLALIYDRPGKGNNLMIEVGKDEMTYAHTITAPTEVLTGQNANGQIVALWITDAAGTKTLIKLQAN